MSDAQVGQVELPELLFGMSWEDPESDRVALQIQPGDSLVTIGSGGCNTFSLLLENPRQVFAVDINSVSIASPGTEASSHTAPGFR